MNLKSFKLKKVFFILFEIRTVAKLYANFSLLDFFQTTITYLQYLQNIKQYLKQEGKGFNNLLLFSAVIVCSVPIFFVLKICLYCLYLGKYIHLNTYC